MMLESRVSGRTANVSLAAPTSAIVRVDQVAKRFGDVTALKGVSLDVPEGAFFSLLGPSGCGKTTLLMILAGLERPTEGDVLLDGAPITRMPPERRPFNLVFQNYALFPHLTVAQNLAFGPRRRRGSRRGPRPADLDAEIAEMLHLVDLEGFELRKPAELSGGQTQRVALARALINRPRMLLLDEPMAALDRNVRLAVRERLLRIHTEMGTTFLMVTHDQEEALSMSTTVALMNHGVVEQLDSPETLYRRPASLFAARFIGSGSLLETPVVGERRGDRVEVELNGHALTPWCSDARPGAPGMLLLRPEELRLTSPGDAILAGQVLTSTFLGQSTEIVVASENGEVRLRSEHAPSPGATVGVTWEPDAGAALAVPPDG